MSGIFHAITTVLAWGTWLIPSQNVSYRNQQIKTFHVAAANLLLASLVMLILGFDHLTLPIFWPPFIGGLIWAVGGFCAFTATHKIGVTKAFGVWAPLNIIVSIIWGAI